MPLTIDLPPEVLAALRGRAAARNRTVEQEAAAALAASVDRLLNPPPPPDPADLWPGGDWRNDPGAVAWVESVRAAAPVPPPAKSPEGSLRDSPREGGGAAADPGIEWPPTGIDPDGGVDVGMSPAEWDAYWWTLEYDGEAAAAEAENRRDGAERSGAAGDRGERPAAGRAAA